MANATLDDMKVEFEAAFRLNDLSGTDLLRFLTSVDCPVQWTRTLDRDQKVFGLIVKPSSQALTDGFGFDYEIPVICSTHREFQPRLLERLQEIETAVAHGRLERDICVIVNDDPRLSEKLEKLDSPSLTLFGISSQEAFDAMTSGQPSHWFRSLLQRKLYARDAFDRAGPVYGQEFFGRKKFMGDLLSQLAKGSSLGLYGLRKVGKTSIIRNLGDAAQSKGMQWLFVHIDLLSAPPNSRDSSYLFWMIAKELGRILPPELSKRLQLRAVANPPRFDQIPNRARFEEAVDSDLRSLSGHFSAQGGRIVVVMDEIEQLFPLDDIRSGFTGYDQFLGYLRGISQTPGLAVSVLVVGVNPNISEAQFLGRGGRRNPMYGFFSNRYAPPMQLEEARDMVKNLGRSTGVRIEVAAIDLIHRLVGGHPFLLRRFCSLLIRDKPRPITVTEPDVTASKDRFLREESINFAEMVSVVKEYYPDEFSTLERIALSDGGVAGSDINRQITGHLEGYQLVIEDEGRLQMRNELMREWFRGLSAPRRQAEPHSRPPVGSVSLEGLESLIKRTEIALRRFVRSKLLEKFGVRADARIELALGQDSMTTARRRRDESLRKFQPDRDASSVEILEYLYIGDLIRVICGPDWSIFRDTFKGNKRAVDQACAVLAPVRNEVQHYRELPPREMLRAQLEASDLLDLIEPLTDDN